MKEKRRKGGTELAKKDEREERRKLMEGRKRERGKTKKSIRTWKR